MTDARDLAPEDGIDCVRDAVPAPDLSGNNTGTARTWQPS